MKIGDEVYVHGYVDEIRKDVVIIRNDGGFFGTDAREVILADRKTEPQTITMVKDHGRKQALEMINLYHELKTEPQTDCSWK